MPTAANFASARLNRHGRTVRAVVIGRPLPESASSVLYSLLTARTPMMIAAATPRSPSWSYPSSGEVGVP